MWRTYLTRFKYLPAALRLLLLLLCYQAAFRPTLEVFRQNRELTAQLDAANDIGSQPGYSERKLSNVSRLLGAYKADTTVFREGMINTLSVLAEKNNVRLTAVPLELPAVGLQQQILTQKLQIEGDYFALLRVLDQLQGTAGAGWVRSVSIGAGGNDRAPLRPGMVLMELTVTAIR